jgi:alanine racemase
VAEISIENLLSNFNLLKSLIQPSHFFCPMVKANAYGHGDYQVTQALESAGATHVGVALIEEAVALRAKGVTLDILIFGLLDSKDAASTCVTKKLTPVIGDFSALDLLSEALAEQNKPSFEIHIEFDTGMSRLGFDVDAAPALINYLKVHPQLRVAGLCTHFFDGPTLSQKGSPAEQQLLKIKKVESLFRSELGYESALHVLNSDAALALQGQNDRPSVGFRPGISLYGAQPLKPVMTLKTQVAAWHQLDVGQSVSYRHSGGTTWKAQQKSLIGVLPIGYGDGYLRALSNRGFVLCRGERAPIVGTICMDYLMIDLTEVESRHKRLLPHEPIVLWGEQLGQQLRAEEIASQASTISYELFTRLGERVPRVYKQAGESS